jgi:hypothetical protein
MSTAASWLLAVRVILLVLVIRIDNNNNNNSVIIIIVTVTKSYSVYIKYYSKQGEKIMVLVRIIVSKYNRGKAY